MPLGTPIIHPRLFASLPLFHQQRVSVYRASGAMNQIGEREQPDRDSVMPPGELLIENVPCNSAPEREASEEVRTLDTEYLMRRERCQIAGLYPILTADQKLYAVVTGPSNPAGVLFAVVGVEQASSESHTVLRLEAKA